MSTIVNLTIETTYGPEGARETGNIEVAGKLGGKIVAVAPKSFVRVKDATAVARAVAKLLGWGLKPATEGEGRIKLAAADEGRLSTASRARKGADGTYPVRTVTLPAANAGSTETAVVAWVQGSGIMWLSGDCFRKRAPAKAEKPAKDAQAAPPQAEVPAEPAENVGL